MYVTSYVNDFSNCTSEPFIGSAYFYKLTEENMSRKLYLIISGTIFGLVALLHLARVVFHWQAQVGAWVVPFWLSWGGLVGAGILSIWAFRQVAVRSHPRQGGSRT